MSPVRPRAEILPGAQRSLWPSLAPIARQKFVLYGGTALALRLGHRQSLDFDFFSDVGLDKAELARSLPFFESSQVVQDAPDTLTILVPVAGEFVKISFFGALGFGRVGEPETTDDGVLAIASVLDLFGTKLKVLFDRVEAKDYLDIGALLKHGHILSDGLGAARALFGRAFQPAEALKALTYFDGGDLDALAPEERELLIEHAAKVTATPTIRVISKSLAL
jgi:hypothetical protein